MSANQENWTDSDTENLRKLSTEGYTASQIAASFPGKTRNAILGKLFRLGIHLRTSGGSGWARNNSFWNHDDNLRKLRGFCESPLGYSQIDMGKVFGVGPSTIRRGLARMKTEYGVGLKPKGFNSLRKGAGERLRARRAAIRAVRPGELAAETVAPAHPVTIWELTSSTCRWPAGGTGHTMLYCGALPVWGEVYCAGHCRRAYAL